MVGVSSTHRNPRFNALSKYQILSHTAYIDFYWQCVSGQFPYMPVHSYCSLFNIIVNIQFNFNYFIVNIILKSHKALFTSVSFLFSVQSYSSWFTHKFVR